MNSSPGCRDVAAPFGLVGQSSEIQRVLDIVQKLKRNRWPVLVLGETGTGKELTARAIHALSPGTSGVFMTVDCAALPPTLIESELFGYVRGSFTGAVGTSRGLFAEADGGTLFLDEIAELPLNMQPKLLRTLEEKEVRPLGSPRHTPVNVRIIAATNRDLPNEVREKRFRLDLYHRLKVITVRLTPLSAHPDDIPVLVRHFLRLYACQSMTMSPDAMRGLVCYDWPGNVRELENCIMGMVAMASGSHLDACDLPPEILDHGSQPQAKAPTPPPSVLPLHQMEKLHIDYALRTAQGNVSRAAHLLGIGKTTLYRKLKESRRFAPHPTVEG
ncbi:MAG TPA: sigma 54-interacting transcriptional regulator [Terriglobales bacterium]|nr:sigma 54-interacting transcriptional regulator [Terriglobales bacterium]